MSTSTINVQFYSDGVKDNYAIPFVVKSVQSFTAKDTSGVAQAGYTVTLGANSAVVVSPKPPENINFNIVCVYDVPAGNTGSTGGSTGGSAGDVSMYLVTATKGLPADVKEVYTAKQQAYNSDGLLTIVGLPVIGNAGFKCALVRAPGELHAFFSQANGTQAYHYVLPDGQTQWIPRSVIGSGYGFQQKGVLTKGGKIVFNSILDTSAATFVLDPASDTSYTTQNSNFAHPYCLPILLDNGYVVQGSSGASPSTADANKIEYWNESTTLWTPLPQMPLTEYSTISAIGNTIYALYQTSNRMFKLNFGDAGWTELFPQGMDFNTHQGQITLLSNQVKLWLVSHTGLMYSYDPVANAWAQERNRFQAVANYGATMDENGVIIVGGGTDANLQIQYYPTLPEKYFKVVGAIPNT